MQFLNIVYNANNDRLLSFSLRYFFTRIKASFMLIIIYKWNYSHHFNLLKKKLNDKFNSYV
jgi:hypothetical protein